MVTSRTPLWTEYKSARELTINLTLRELKGKYKRSVLGWTWSLLNPLATIAIFALVFKFFLKIDAPHGDPSGTHNFALFLVAALLPWNYLNNGLNASMGALCPSRWMRPMRCSSTAGFHGSSRQMHAFAAR